jgi:CO dehydrogenase/acetyl-CoA synthase beta subunit
MKFFEKVYGVPVADERGLQEEAEEEEEEEEEAAAAAVVASEQPLREMAGAAQPAFESARA